MKFLKTVGTVVLWGVLIGMFSYEFNRVQSNLDGTPKGNTTINSEVEPVSNFTNNTTTFTDKSLQALTSLLDMQFNNFTKKYNTTAKATYVSTKFDDMYGREFAIYDISTGGNYFKRVHIAPVDSEILVLYVNDNEVVTLDQFFDDVESNLIFINEQAAAHIEDMKNKTALVPEEIVENELSGGLFGSAGEESWYQKVEPLGDAGYETTMTKESAIQLMKEAFPNAQIELLEVRDLDFLFSVVSNNTGNPEDSIYGEYTVPNNFPEIYDISGNCIYAK